MIRFNGIGVAEIIDIYSAFPFPLHSIRLSLRLTIDEPLRRTALTACTGPITPWHTRALGVAPPVYPRNT